MLMRKMKTVLAIPAVATIAVLLQGSCTTTPWHVWHYPYAGENASATATVYELDIEVIPPNPPTTWEYTTVETWIPLDSGDMNIQYYESYPGYSFYLGHDAEFGPDMAGASALLIARYPHAYKVQMESAGQNGNGTYITEDTSRPADWSYCGPAYP